MSYETRYAAKKRMEMDRLASTPEAYEERLKASFASEKTLEDLRNKYPVINSENFVEADEYRQERNEFWRIQYKKRDNYEK